MRKQSEFLPIAEQEAADAYAWYARDNLRAAEGFLAKLIEAREKIETRPHSFPQHRRNTRRCLLAGYPYSVVFVEHADLIVLVAVAHCSRRPGYWAGRLK
jgi:toxin ParE1/3/4